MVTGMMHASDNDFALLCTVYYIATRAIQAYHEVPSSPCCGTVGMHHMDNLQTKCGWGSVRAEHSGTLSLVRGQAVIWRKACCGSRVHLVRVQRGSSGRQRAVVLEDAVGLVPLLASYVLCLMSCVLLRMSNVLCLMSYSGVCPMSYSEYVLCPNPYVLLGGYTLVKGERGG